MLDEQVIESLRAENRALKCEIEFLKSTIVELENTLMLKSNTIHIPNDEEQARYIVFLQDQLRNALAAIAMYETQLKVVESRKKEETEYNAQQTSIQKGRYIMKMERVDDDLRRLKSLTNLVSSLDLLLTKNGVDDSSSDDDASFSSSSSDEDDSGSGSD